MNKIYKLQSHTYYLKTHLLFKILLKFILLGDLELLGRRQRFVSSICAGTSDERKARIDVQDFKTSY